ncbi:MAG: hypothetical protein IH624_01605 [Phycisphaerae bacterium]|nr:hypothetical protein [Phycisphaerae bacterium]
MLSSQNARKSSILSVLAALLCISALPAVAQEPDNPLKFVPADCLFCVRINNFDNAASLADKYMEDVAPSPLMIAMITRLPLIQLVGDPLLRNLNFEGDFIAFGMADTVSADSKIAYGFILPITDYETFISEHPRATKPDENGISRLSLGIGDAETLVRKAGSYAIFTDKRNYNGLAAISKRLEAGEIRTVADTIDTRRSRGITRSPIWAYGNVQRVREVFGPDLFERFEKARAGLEQKRGRKRTTAFPGMDIYIKTLKEVLEDVDSVTWSVRPSADVLRIATSIKPVEGKGLAEALKASSTPKGPNPLLPHFDENAMMNLGMKIDKPLWIRFYNEMFAIFTRMSGETLPQDDLARLKRLTNTTIGALGDALAFSMTARPGMRPPFKMRYIAQVEDAETLNRVLDEQIQLMNDGAVDDLYKAMGLDMKFTAKRNVATYQGVQIDSATLKFNAADGDSEMDKQIKALYGEGLEYRWAIVDDLLVYAISGEVDKDIRALIDQVKSGEPKELDPELTQAMSLLPDPRGADAVGTVNFVRLMQMSLGRVTAGDQSMKIDVPTENHLVFASRVREGRIVINCALPKKHLIELRAASEEAHRQMQERRQQQVEPASEQPL